MLGSEFCDIRKERHQVRRKNMDTIIASDSANSSRQSDRQTDRLDGWMDGRTDGRTVDGCSPSSSPRPIVMVPVWTERLTTILEEVKPNNGAEIRAISSLLSPVVINENPGCKLLKYGPRLSEFKGFGTRRKVFEPTLLFSRPSHTVAIADPPAAKPTNLVVDRSESAACKTNHQQQHQALLNRESLYLTYKVSFSLRHHSCYVYGHEWISSTSKATLGCQWTIHS